MQDKIIHAHIYDPSQRSLFKADANAKAKLFVVTCSNSANCDLYKVGTCVKRIALGGNWCEYGKEQNQIGRFTKRARKFRDDIIRWKEAYKEELESCSLSSPVDKIAVVGEYYYLPYSFMFHNNSKVQALDNGGFFVNGRPFIKKDDFTGQVIIDLVNHRPQAMMGGEIIKYQREIVPTFVLHLYESYPQLYAEANKIQDLSKFVKEADYVGRMAIVTSLKEGTVVYRHNGEPFMWDGEYLVAQSNKISFPIIDDYEEVIIKFKPSAMSSVKITSNDQVDENTIFKS